MEPSASSLSAYLFDTLLMKHIPKGSTRVISVIGSGGKTSLIEILARECLSHSLRVLITPTTKMAHPDVHSYTPVDTVVLDPELLPDTGRCVLWGRPSGEKISGIEPSILEESLELFDVVLIEADGSNRLPLKMHREGEPVLTVSTDVTLQVFGLSSIGKRSDEVIHRSMLYRNTSGVVEVGTICDLVLEPVKTRGHRLILINQCDLVEPELLDELSAGLEQVPIQILFGSVKDNSMWKEQSL